jgi:polysaccharide chain length determinant protein (PEP-CTERM system associated)
MDSEQGIQLDDLKKILQRRGRMVLAFAVVGFLAAVFVAAVLPNEYQSQATLLIEPQTISEKLVQPNLSETDLNSRLHLISMQILSRGRLSKVIDELNVYPELADEMTREEVIESMRGQISVTPVLSELEARVGIRNTRVEINTFQLAYRHRDRDVAAAVANRLANDFVEEHIKARAEMSGDTSEFIEAELQRLSARIADVEERIATIKTVNVGRLPEDLPTNQNTYERLIQTMRDAQRELAIAQSDEAFYRQQVLAGGGDPFQTRNQDSPERRLDAMRVALGEAASRGLTDKHPDVVKLRREIQHLEKRLEEGTVAEGDAPLSMAQKNAKAEEQRAGLRVTSAREELERIQSQLAEVEQRMAETPRVAEQLASLEREHQHLFDSYQQYSGKRLEAGVAADMERRQKGEKFRVLEAAVPSPAATSPNRPVILALGLVLGLLVGGGLGLLAEVTDLSFHDPRSLQNRLGIPVLASVPAVVLESDRARGRRRRIRNLIGAAIVASLVVFASLAGNWIVNGAPGPLARLLSGGMGEAPAAGEARAPRVDTGQGGGE